MNVFVDTDIRGGGGMGTVSREFFVKSLGKIFDVRIVNGKTGNHHQCEDGLFFKYGWRQDIYQDFSNCDVLYNLPKQNVHKNIFVMPFDACMLNPKKIEDINLSYVQIWCDSNFTLNQAEKAGIDKNKLRLFRLGIHNPGSFKTNSDDGIFKFINISGPEMFKVKGMDILIKSFLETFRNRRDVELHIKTSSKNGYDIFLQDYIKSEQQKRGLDAANIRVVSDIIENGNIYNFMTRFDCYVQTSRAETFGLPVLEAMSVGLPVISSSYGGVLDFLNDNNSVLVDGNVQRMARNEWRNNREASWYETNPSNLREAMLEMLSGKRRYLEEALCNADKVRRIWDWDNSVSFNMRHINEIV